MFGRTATSVSGRFLRSGCVLAFWPGISAAMRARERGLANRFGDASFHRAVTILALTSRHADLSHESDLLRNPIPCGNPWIESMSQMIQ
jgi:hypothetical protein